MFLHSYYLVLSSAFMIWKVWRVETTEYLDPSSIYILVDEEYDITLASYGSGTGTQTRIESDCGNFQGAIAQGII